MNDDFDPFKGAMYIILVVCIAMLIVLATFIPFICNTFSGSNSSQTQIDGGSYVVNSTVKLGYFFQPDTIKFNSISYLKANVTGVYTTPLNGSAKQRVISYLMNTTDEQYRMVQ